MVAMTNKNYRHCRREDGRVDAHKFFATSSTLFPQLSAGRISMKPMGAKRGLWALNGDSETVEICVKAKKYNRLAYSDSLLAREIICARRMRLCAGKKMNRDRL